MPIYDYKCTECGKVATHKCGFEDRLIPRYCSCEGWMEYQFPVEAAKGFQDFQPYYDETLDMDINGRREKQQIMAAQGLQEAGDPVGGARNFDKHAPVVIDKQPVRGRSLSDVQQERQQANDHEFIVGIEDSKGHITPVNAKDLPSYTDSAGKRTKKAKEQSHV